MEWISVNDRLPDDNICVLMYTECGVVIGNRYGKRWYAEESIYITYPEESLLYNNVTHWMPLPEPPEDHASYAV